MAAGSFEDFVAGRDAALLRFGHLLTHDAGRAEDLVQDALVKAHRRWPSIDQGGRPEAYVRRIMVNDFISWRRRKASSERTGAVPEQPVADMADRVGERDLMWRALATLPARQRAVLVLRFYEELTDAEIADVLGCAAGTVRSLVSRAMADLRSRPGWTSAEPGSLNAEER